MTIHIEPGGGTSLPSGSVIRLRGEQTGGALAMVEATLGPKKLIGHHVHDNDVWVHVLSGRVGVRVGDEIAEGEAGSWLLKPRGVPHAMWNPGDEPARIYEFLTPAGSERFFEEVATLPGSDDDAVRSLAARYGIRFVEDSDWNEELLARFS